MSPLHYLNYRKPIWCMSNVPKNTQAFSSKIKKNEECQPWKQSLGGVSLKYLFLNRKNEILVKFLKTTCEGVYFYYSYRPITWNSCKNLHPWQVSFNTWRIRYFKNILNEDSEWAASTAWTKNNREKWTEVMNNYRRF